MVVKFDPDFTIRRATASDRDDILHLLDFYYTEWDIWQRDPPAQVRNYLQHPTLGYLLALCDGQPAGCVLLRPLPAIPAAAECKRLFVAPEFRGRRLADALMQAAEDQARAAGLLWLYLDTKPEFAAAIALYRRRGYEEVPRFNDNAQATLFLRLPLG